MIKETERLRFRSWTINDAEVCFSLASDEHVGPPCGWMPHKDLEDTQGILREILINDHTFCIIEKSTGNIIGSIGIDPYYEKDENGNRTLVEGEREIGFWLGYPYWNKGYMTEALRSAIEYCFDELKIMRVICCHFVHNPASGHVQEKCGFKYLKTEKVFCEPLGMEIDHICNCLELMELK